MKAIKNSVVIIFALIVSLFSAESLMADGGSNYSIFGIGDILYSNNAVYSGMGGTSIAIPSEHAINPNNPALWGKVNTSRLQVGYRFSQNSIKTGSLITNQNNGGVDGILGLLSVDTSLGIGVSFGLMPYTSVNYLNNSPELVKIGDLELQGKSTYKGTGGLSKFYLGSSCRIYDELFVGASVFAGLGTIESSVKTELYDYYSFETESRRKDYFSGFGYKAGLYYGIGGLSFGTFIEQFSSMDINTDIIYISNVMNDTTFQSSGSIDMPSTYGFGLSYLTGKFLFGADIALQDFSGFSYHNESDFSYKNSMNVSFGLSRLGNPAAGAKTFDKITYNLGFAYKELYYSVLDNNINDIFGSVGMSIPMGGFTNLDLSVQIGSRGIDKSGLVNELYGKFMINMSIGEDSWFKPFKRSYE